MYKRQICDNVKVGVSLIFQLLNMADFIDYTEFHKGSLFYAPMYLSGLSVSGKIILPLMKTCLLYTSECQINVEDENIKYTRANIVIITKSILKDALSLLGIQCPEQM